MKKLLTLTVVSFTLGFMLGAPLRGCAKVERANCTENSYTDRYAESEDVCQSKCIEQGCSRFKLTYRYEQNPLCQCRQPGIQVGKRGPSKMDQIKEKEEQEMGDAF